MNRPLGVTSAGWFLVASGLFPLLFLLLPDTPPSPQAAAFAAAMPPHGRFQDALWWIDAAVSVASGALVLRGARAGRVLALSWGAVSLGLLAWNLAGPAGAEQVAMLHATAFALALASINIAAYLAIAVLLLRRPAAEWFALPPGRRSFPAWSVRGVLGTVLLAVGGFALYGWLLLVLLDIAMVSAKGVTPPTVIAPAFATIPVAVLLAIGLAVAPGRHGRRRLAVVGLCASLFALFVALLLGTILCSSLAQNVLPPGQVPDWFGPRLLLACPVLLAVVAPCVLVLRRPRADSVVAPG